MAVKTYNAKEVAVVFGGFGLSGFGDSEFLSIEMNEDQWELKVGVDGNGTRSKQNNFSAKIKVILMQSSDSNRVMQNFWNADRLTSTGAAPFLAKDNSGASLHFCETAWVMKQPVAKFAKGVEMREWTLETDNMNPFEGGN